MMKQITFRKSLAPWLFHYEEDRKVPYGPMRSAFSRTLQEWAEVFDVPLLSVVKMASTINNDGFYIRLGDKYIQFNYYPFALEGKMWVVTDNGVETDYLEADMMFHYGDLLKTQNLNAL
jgi:hypothetical protein